MESIKNEPILTAPSAIAHQQDGPSRRKRDGVRPRVAVAAWAHAR